MQSAAAKLPADQWFLTRAFVARINREISRRRAMASAAQDRAASAAGRVASYRTRCAWRRITATMGRGTTDVGPSRRAAGIRCDRHDLRLLARSPA